MKNIKKVIVTLFVGFLLIKNSFSLSCSEREIIMIALQNNNTIRLTKEARIYDSLSIKMIKSGWLPELQLMTDPSISYLNGNKTISATMSAQIEQKIPGGGNLFAGIKRIDAQSDDISVNQKTVKHTDDVSIGITQPFLKNAANFNDIHYNVHLSLLDNKNLTLDKRKTINETLTQIRVQYWDYCSQQLLDSTYKQVLLRNEELLKTSRVQYAIGEISELDTLSTSLSYYQSLQQCFESELLLNQAKNKLARLINVSHDSLTVIIQRPDSISDLPDVSTLISTIKKFDPSIKKFNNLQEKFGLMYKKQKNSLFPLLDGYIKHNYLKNDRTATQCVTDNNTVFGLLMTYSIPLTKNKIALEQLTVQQRISTNEAENYNNDLNIKIRELHDSWIQEKKRIELAKKSNSIAALQYGAAIKAFSVGTIDRQSLLKIQNDLLESNVTYIRLLITMKKIEILFDELTGTVFDRYGITY